MDGDIIDISSSDSEGGSEVRNDSNTKAFNNAVIGSKDYLASDHDFVTSNRACKDGDKAPAFTSPNHRKMDLTRPSVANFESQVHGNGNCEKTFDLNKGSSVTQTYKKHNELSSLRRSQLDDCDYVREEKETCHPTLNNEKRTLPPSFQNNAFNNIPSSSLHPCRSLSILPYHKTQVQNEPSSSLNLNLHDITGKSSDANSQQEVFFSSKSKDQEEYSILGPSHHEHHLSSVNPNYHGDTLCTEGKSSWKTDPQKEFSVVFKSNQERERHFTQDFQQDGSSTSPTKWQQGDCTIALDKWTSSDEPPSKRRLPSSLLPAASRSKPQYSKERSPGIIHDFSVKPNAFFESKNSDKVPMELMDDSDDDELFMCGADGTFFNMSSWCSGKNTMSSHSADLANAGNCHRGGSYPPEGESLAQDTDKTGSRLLPPWMNGKNVHEKVHSNFQQVDLSGSREHPGVGEREQAENDERLIFEVAMQDLAQPEFEADLAEGLLSVSLLRHQKIALAWLDQKETSFNLPCVGGILADDQGLGKTVSMIALIQKQMPLQKKFMSKQPEVTSVALNLDEDDYPAPADGKAENVGGDLHLKSMASCSSVPIYPKGKPATGTLVVCPASIMQQWAHELDEKVGHDSKLSVLIYHGGSRTKLPVDLAKYDVVLTTYAIVTNEVPKKPIGGDDDGELKIPEEYGLTSDFSVDKKKKMSSFAGKKKKKKGKENVEFDGGPLARVRWFRVILDEAQIIKNHRTQVARACCGLRAKRRWCLSGTPLQNAIDDLYSYFRFLRYHPYATYSSFCSALKNPILRNSQLGYKKLQAVLRIVMLRRTKGTLIDGKPILNLPSKSITLKKLNFSLEERTFYIGLEANFRERFKRYAAEGTIKQNYANILLMLLRLRQACDHPLLVKDYDSDFTGKTPLETAKKLPKQKLSSLLIQLETSFSICGLCNDPPEDAVVTLCGHIFCYQCISESLESDENFCPISGCREMLDSDSVFSKGTLKCCTPDDHANDAASSFSLVPGDTLKWTNGFTSSKIKATTEILKSLNSVNISYSEATSSMCTSVSFHPKLPAKAIVFSQWTGMLDFIEATLNHSLIQYRRLDGSMSLASRDQAVKDFNADPEVTVMLMSLKAGNLGLNMIAASHVILLDLWWNPTSEDQAIDRAHRIGQTQSVTVHRLTVEDTVEERILRLQEKKRDMVSSVFGEDQSGRSASRLTLGDLAFLFRV